MKKKINYSYIMRKSRKLNTELNQKLKENTKIKMLKKNKLVIKNQINNLSSKKLKLFNHFDLTNNNLLHYIAELNYKINKKIFKPDIVKKEEDIIDYNRNNLKTLSKFKEFHKNKLIDDKYKVENKTNEYFKKEEEREINIIKEHIIKDNIVYQELNEAKNDLSLITNKFRKQILKTENNENCGKDLKLKLDIIKNINMELSNILNKEKEIQNKLKEMDVENKKEKKCYSHRAKNIFNSPDKAYNIGLNNINEFKDINKYPNTPRNPKIKKISFKKDIDNLTLENNKSSYKYIITNSSKKTLSRNNYISTTIGNSSEKNKYKISHAFLSQDDKNEKNELNEFRMLIENEIKQKENNIKSINILINEEFQMQYYIKILCIKCIEELKKDIKTFNDKKIYLNQNNKNIINGQINETENKLNIFNYILDKCLK